MIKVAFQGIPGAYSEEAIREYFGKDAESVPCRTLEEVFARVDSGEVKMGMVPIENAVAGSVAGSYELLMDHDLTIFAEVILRVHHMLLGIPGHNSQKSKRCVPTPRHWRSASVTSPAGVCCPIPLLIQLEAGRNWLPVRIKPLR